MNEVQSGGVRIEIGHTSEFDSSVLAMARELLYVVFDDMTDHDWEHALGGMHTIAWHENSIVGHASVVQRRLMQRGQALRTGYVEGVGVDPSWQGRGVGGLMMAPLERIIEGAYDIGALGASDEAVAFYEHRGWLKWLGETWALTPTGVVRTPDEDDSIFVWPAARSVDIAGDLTCDWRDGDGW
jgi:aminoglycoside 2'-N-acetyltransferase I